MWLWGKCRGVTGCGGGVMGSQWAVGEVWWGNIGLWERCSGVIWGCGRFVEESHMGVGEMWWGHMGLRESFGGVI